MWIGCTSWGALPKRSVSGMLARVRNTLALVPSLPYTSEGCTM